MGSSLATDFLWFYGAPDGEFPWEPEGRFATSQESLKALAAEIDSLPYSGALFATGVHDVWVMAVLASSVSNKLRPLIAIHPNLISPTLLAKMVASYANIFGHRLLINVINGETPVMESFGVWAGHDARYALSAEYWDVFDRIIRGETVTFHGKHVHVSRAAVPPGLAKGLGHVPLWFSGSSDVALDLMGKQFDKYLSWGEPPGLLAGKIEQVREKADKYGRTVDFGLRLPLIVGETDDEAWAIADRYIRVTKPSTIQTRLNNLRQGGSYGGDSIGIQRQGAVGDAVSFNARDYEVSPHLWGGMRLLNNGAPAALVGSARNVAERLAEYEAIGVNTFILSEHPLKGGARHIAETVLPLLSAETRKSSSALSAVS